MRTLRDHHAYSPLDQAKPMELNLQQAQSEFLVRRVEKGAVVVGGKTLTRSFVLTPEQLITDWPVNSVNDIDQDNIDQLLGLEPEVVLLGSGPKQQFAPPSVQAALLRRGIGLECMDSAACARTYNLIVNEGRRVIAAFVIS